MIYYLRSILVLLGLLLWRLPCPPGIGSVPFLTGFISVMTEAERFGNPARSPSSFTFLSSSLTGPRFPSLSNHIELVEDLDAKLSGLAASNSESDESSISKIKPEPMPSSSPGLILAVVGIELEGRELKPVETFEIDRSLRFGVPGNGTFIFVPGIGNLPLPSSIALLGVEVVPVSGLSRLSRSASDSDEEEEYRFSISNLTPIAVLVDRVLRIDPFLFNGAIDERSEEEGP
jgi:hypothetical protein